MSAFLAAWEAGFEWCECDVRMCACGRAVVLHDETLDRTTSLRGAVEQIGWEEARGARLRRVDGVEVEESLCLLEEVLEVMKKEGKRRMLVEIKGGCDERLAGAVGRMLEGSGCAVQSFDALALARAWREVPGVDAYLLCHHLEEALEEAEGQWSGINVRHDQLSAELVGRVHGRGKTVGVWTPNSREDLERVMGMGVDRIITNRPGLRGS